MATTSASMKPSKVRWDEDEDDDWDMETYLETTDNSAPKVSDLGPLQILPSAEDVEFVVERIENERTIQGTTVEAGNDSDDETEDEDAYEDEDAASEPGQFSNEQYYQDDAEYDNTECEIESARYDLLSRAIGSSFDGKESPNPAAYIEINREPTPLMHSEVPDRWDRRREYSFNFKNYMTLREKPRSVVYRNSPLCLVTHIDEARLIDDIIDEEEESPLDVYEEQMIHDFLQEELDNYTDLNEEDEEEDADETAERLEKIYTKEELRELYSAFEESPDGVNSSEESDSDDSVQSWEEDELEEQDATELWNPSENYDANMPFSLTGRPAIATIATEDEKTPQDWKQILGYTEENGMGFSIKGRATAESSINDDEDLDFNVLTFGDEEEVAVTIVEARDSRDEGYISSSPPFSPTLDVFPKTKEASEWFPINTLLSASSLSRKTHARAKSMESLKAFRETAKNEAAVEDALEGDEDDQEPDEVDTVKIPEEIQEIDTENDGQDAIEDDADTQETGEAHNIEDTQEINEVDATEKTQELTKVDTDNDGQEPVEDAFENDTDTKKTGEVQTTEKTLETVDFDNPQIIQEFTNLSTINTTPSKCFVPPTFVRIINPPPEATTTLELDDQDNEIMGHGYSQTRTNRAPTPKPGFLAPPPKNKFGRLAPVSKGDTNRPPTTDTPAADNVRPPAVSPDRSKPTSLDQFKVGLTSTARSGKHDSFFSTPLFRTEDENHPTGLVPKGVLNRAFFFPACEVNTSPTPQSTGPADKEHFTLLVSSKPSRYRYSGPMAAKNAKVKKEATLSTIDHIAGAVTEGWFHMGIVPWTTVGVVVAGVTVAGLVKLVQRR